jgi:CheY-like chemotaxis protein
MNAAPDRRILVIEDEGLIALHIEDALTDLGCSVVGPVRAVEEAINLLDRQPVDAALLDINLGGGQTSYPIADELGRRDIPFAFVTGYDALGLLPQYRSRPIVAKPIDNARLAETVAGLVPGLGA